MANEFRIQRARNTGGRCRILGNADCPIGSPAYIKALKQITDQGKRTSNSHKRVPFFPRVSFGNKKKYFY